jgi:hypothetical protein
MKMKSVSTMPLPVVTVSVLGFCQVTRSTRDNKSATVIHLGQKIV